MAGNPALKLFMVMLAIVGLMIVVYFGMNWLSKYTNGDIISANQLIEQLQKKVSQQEDTIDDLQKENSELKDGQRGIPTAFIVIVLALFVIAMIFMAATEGRAFGNLTRGQAIKLADKLMLEERTCPFYENAHSACDQVWYYRDIQVGDVVEGDIDAVWYVISYCHDRDVSRDMVPDHAATTVLIKSNDAERRVHIEPGRNARSACKIHGIKLQRSPKPADLNSLAGVKLATEYEELLTKLKGDVSDN